MAYNFHSDYKADNVNTEKKTIKKNREYVVNVSDPNILNDFASYNALFTLSALTERQIETGSYLTDTKLYSVIAGVRALALAVRPNQTVTTRQV